MSYLVIENFQGGLDTRKARLAAAAGTLTEGVDGHITPGGEFEKRKAFVALVNPNVAETDSLVPNTFGLQPVATGLMVFGSADLSAATWPTDADGQAVQYQRLQHPAVLAGETYASGSHAMTAVVYSEVYEGKSFVIAQFADGRRFCYYDGALVSDFTAGLVLPYLAGDNAKLATAVKNLLDGLTDYSATQVAVTVTGTAAGGGGKVRLTFTPATVIPTGTTVRSAGIVGTTEANGLWLATFVDSTHIDLDGTTFANAWVSGGAVTTSLVDVTGPLGVEFELTLTPTSPLGTFTTPSNTVAPIMPVTGNAASGYFRITGGSQYGTAATAASGSIEGNLTPGAGQYVIVGNKKYTFRATPTVEGEVKINGVLGSLTNLKNAINRDAGTPGTDYVVARAHPWITAGTITGAGPYTLPLTGGKGVAGHAASLTDGGTGYTLTQLTGGTGNCISQVKVLSETEGAVNLLGAAVDWSTSNEVTAGLVMAEINNNTAAGLTHGYTATVDGDEVLLHSPLASAADKNNYRVQVTAGGNVCVGACMFYLVQLVSVSSAALNSIVADGQNLVVAGSPYVTYPSGGTLDSMDELYAKIAADINARSLVTGFLAYATATFVQLSRVTTRSDDIDVPVYITPSGGVTPTFGVRFGTPPEHPVPLSAELPDALNEVADWPYPSFGARSGGQSIVTDTVVGLTPVTIVPQGGSGSYTGFNWRAAYSGSNTGSLDAPGSYNFDWIIEPVVNNQATTLFRVRSTNYGSLMLPITLSGVFVCEFTDGVNTFVSAPITVTFTIA